MSNQRRGMWIPETVNKTASIKPNRYGARPATAPSSNASNSEEYLKSRNKSEEVLPLVVSDHRRESLIRGTVIPPSKTDNTAPLIVHSNSYKRNQEIKKTYGFDKTASSISSGGGNSFGFGGGTNTVRQAPEIYSPLFQMANLQLPRDRITMNAWNRNFYDTHPLVHNCINLHATYPISKINIKCKDQRLQQFFQDMADDMDLVGALQNIALEFWKIGEKVSKDTTITMADGTLKKIIDIKVGDEVLTHLGNKKKVVELFAKPTNTTIEEHLKIYKVSVEGLHEPLIISGKHPIFTLSKNEIKCTTLSCQKKNMRILPNTGTCSNCGKKYDFKYNPDFKEMLSIQEHDIVFAPFHKDVRDNSKFTKELCYIIGFWLAEGSYIKAVRKGVRSLYEGIKFTNYDYNFLIEQLAPIFEKEIGNGIIYRSDSDNHFGYYNDGQIVNKYEYCFAGKKRGGWDIANLFREHCGEYSTEKKLSDLIMNLPVEKQLEILAGFIDGDGCVDQSNGHIIISTSSKNLANQFQIILRRSGIKTTLSKQKSKMKGEFTGNYNYRVKILANDSFKFFKSRLKSNKAEKLKNTKWSSNRTSMYQNWQLLTIKKIEDITKNFTDEFMYDIEVEDDHSYIANGFAIHNCFPYAELDESRGIWKRITIQNPDYIHVKTAILSGESTISLRPDAALQRLVQSNNPADIQLRQNIPEEILYHVRKGNNIPLDNFHISHLKMLSSPYDIHGTSLIVSIYKDLMLYDKLRESKFAQADNLVNPITLVKVGGTGEGEYHPTQDALEKYRQVFECYDEETEVLTDQGFKKYHETFSYTKKEDGDYETKVKPDIKIACFNAENEQLEYHEPNRATLYDYNGEMYCFSGEKVDIKVTPNHRMLANRRNNWIVVNSSDVVNNDKFRSVVDWHGKDMETLNVCDINIPLDDYLEFLGYVISEGYVSVISGKYFNNISITQQNIKEDKKTIKMCMSKIASYFGSDLKERVYVQKFETSSSETEMWKGLIYNSRLTKHIYNEIGENEKCNSHNKRIPRWIFDLKREHLKKLLYALSLGDAHIQKNKNDKLGYKYSSISERLADDVFELAFKCGYAPNKYKAVNGDGKEYWIVSYSDGTRGKFPSIIFDKRRKNKPITVEIYTGKVWCFTVPTGFFITRRNGKITIQGNSAQYDKDFKIITHAGVSVERVGASGQIIDIGNDMNFIVDNILFGLMTPKAILTQDGASFNSASIGLEVLKQRYETFRNMMSKWLVKKIFAPISEIQEFYEYKDGEKKLIVPEVDWNQMILYDMDNYINVLQQLATQNPERPTISKATLFRSLGLSIEEERRKIKDEMINTTIMLKEQQILQSMSLGALRSIKAEDDIIEPTEAPLPGTPGAEEAGMPTGGMMGGPLGGGADLGGLLGPSSGPTPPLGGSTPPAPTPLPPAPGGGSAPPPAPTKT